MKTKNFIWRTMHICMVAAVCVLSGVSCSEDPLMMDPTPIPTPSPEPTPSPSSDNGEIEFEFISNSETGTEIGTSPVLVSQGDTLNMVISQKSSYTDSDGTVFECEPKASIELFAKLDTVYVKELSQLITVQEAPKVQSSENGYNPIVNTIDQNFLIGDQDINFALSYEVYKYTAASGDTIEMPYVKLNQATFGRFGTVEETEPKARSETVLTAITVKPLPKTKLSISDTTWYEVNATFNLNVECMNSSKEDTLNLAFSVSYLGAVTREIELKDPVSELLTITQVLSGTKSTSSPFVVEPKETLSLLFKQYSKYTDPYGNNIVCEPETKIKLFAQTDTIYADTAEEFEGIPTASKDFAFTASGEYPVLYSAVQLFEFGKQNINLEMSYETYVEQDIENNEISMPYLKPKTATAGNATVRKISTVTGITADTTFYEVKVPIKVEMVDMDVTNDKTETIEMIVSYVGATVTVKEIPKLVKVAYRTGYTWEEAHHNLPLLYYAKVYRDRYYSNGEVITDEFVDNGHPAELVASTGINTGFPCEVLIDEDQRNDSIWTSNCVIAVEDMSTFRTEIVLDENDPGTWEKYVVGKLYEDNVNISEENYTCVGDYENTSLQSGWYFDCFSHCQYFRARFDGATIMTLYTSSRMYDQFLSIDGKIINFLKYKPERHFSHKVEEISFDTSKYTRGVKLTGECTTYYLGRKFYCQTVLTLYEKK